MGRRFDGPHVCHLLVQARRAFVGRAFMVTGGEVGHVLGAQLAAAGPPGAPMPPGPLKVLHWFNRYLEDDDERKQLREWLRVKVGAGGPSLREIVAAHPSWGSWSTFNRRRAAVCKRIAAALNERGVPWFDLDDQGRVVAGEQSG